jgi:hypothetical protein
MQSTNSSRRTEMQKLTSIQEKVLWIIGSLERLATLGLLDADVPYAIAPIALDNYLKIDEERKSITHQEIRDIMKSLANDSPDSNLLAELLIQYRDHRTETVKFALSHSNK